MVPHNTTIMMAHYLTNSNSCGLELMSEMRIGLGMRFVNGAILR